jgi:hypothetical protein
VLQLIGACQQTPIKASIVTILFIPLSAEQGKLESDWAVVSKILRRRCPLRELDSIIGHGRRRSRSSAIGLGFLSLSSMREAV